MFEVLSIIVSSNIQVFNEIIAYSVPAFSNIFYFLIIFDGAIELLGS